MVFSHLKNQFVANLKHLTNKIRTQTVTKKIGSTAPDPNQGHFEINIKQALRESSSE